MSTDERKAEELGTDYGPKQMDTTVNGTDCEEQKMGNLSSEDNVKSGLNDDTTSFASLVERVEDAFHVFMSRNKARMKTSFYISMLVVYFAYFIYCMQYRFGDEGSIILLVITIFLVWRLFFKYLDRAGIDVGLPKAVVAFLESDKGRRLRKRGRIVGYVTASAAIITYLSLSVFTQHPGNVQPFVGMLVFVLVSFLFSSKPSKVNWYPVFWSFVVQFVVAALTLRTQVGHDIFQWLGDQVENLLAFADEGAVFVIGEDFRDWGLAFSATGLVIFVNAFIFLLNHLGVIEFVVIRMGSGLAFFLGTGPVESVVAAANIFLGITEAPLLVRPYLPTITNSELHAIMTCGFASISGGTLAMFVGIGAPANHLLTAAVISAPAALAFSKLMFPETDRVTIENQGNIKMVDDSQSETNALNAFSEGAVMGLRLAASVFSNMLAFVSMLALADSLSVWAGERAGVDGLTFSVISSYILYPVAYAMGVDTGDCRRLGRLLGVRWFSTPFVAYSQLGDLIENRKAFEDYTSVNDTWHWDGDDVILEGTNVTLVDGFIQERTEVIATYALCGHSALTSIGIVMGTLPPLCPARKQDILKLVTGAFVAGNVATFATGAVAGILFSPEN